ncbi:hypothetical protein THOM_0767, partial [Trachipleistophora hominis]
VPDQETRRILDLQMKDILDMELCTDYMKLLRMKYEVKAFLPYLTLLNEWNVISLKHDENTIRVTMKSATAEFWAAVNQDVKTDVHLTISERERFFETCKSIEEKGFYRECLFVINRDYDAEKAKILSARLTALKKQIPSIYDSDLGKTLFLPQVLYRPYIDVKKDLMLNGHIDIKKYKFVDLETILMFMRERRIICEYRACTSAIEFTNTFKLKINVTMYNITFPEQLNRSEGRNEEMHAYHLKYLNLVYYTLLRAGSLDIDRLSEMITVLEPFEILEFVKHFNTLFKTTTIDEKVVVCICENEEVQLKFL